MLKATDTLRRLGPKYGPSFIKCKKKFLYVPRVIASEHSNIT